MFKNMAENIPGGNFPGGSLLGGSFPDTIFLLLQRKLNSR